MILVAHSYFLRNDKKQLERMKPYPPLATLIAAAYLRDHGHRLTLFDATFADGVDAFVAALRAAQPSVVAIIEDNFNFLTKMCTVRAREATLAMVSAAARMGCRVVVNGSDASDHQEMYLEAGADAVVLGEAEETVLALANAWARDENASLDGIPGLTIASTVGPRTTGRRESIRDLDVLPHPAWDLVDATAYERAWRAAHGRFSWNVVTSRGCPFGCNWCAKPVFGRRYARHSPMAVAQQLHAIKTTVGADHIWFADDIFGMTAPWIAEFAQAVTSLDARIPFMMQSRSSLMTPDVVAALASAGAEEVWMGVESGSQRILDAMDKGSTVDEVRAATRALKAHGIRACWFIQLGYPPEDWDDLEQTRQLILEEQPDDIGVSVAYPLPGTKFYTSVLESLGEQRNWDYSGDLAILFQGTYTSEFYRLLRDSLHEQARARTPCDRLLAAMQWERLAASEMSYRSEQALALASS